MRAIDLSSSATRLAPVARDALTRARAEALRAHGVSLREIARRYDKPPSFVRGVLGLRSGETKPRKYPPLSSRVKALGDPDLTLRRCARAEWPAKLQVVRDRLEHAITHYRDPRRWSQSCQPYHGPWETELATWMLASRDERTARAKLDALEALGRQRLDAAKPGIVPPLPVPENFPA